MGMEPARREWAGRPRLLECSSDSGTARERPTYDVIASFLVGERIEDGVLVSSFLTYWSFQDSMSS